LNVTLTAL